MLRRNSHFSWHAFSQCDLQSVKPGAWWWVQWLNSSERFTRRLHLTLRKLPCRHWDFRAKFVGLGARDGVEITRKAEEAVKYSECSDQEQDQWGSNHLNVCKKNMGHGQPPGVLLQHLMQITQLRYWSEFSTLHSEMVVLIFLAI